MRKKFITLFLFHVQAHNQNLHFHDLQVPDPNPQTLGLSVQATPVQANVVQAPGIPSLTIDRHSVGIDEGDHRRLAVRIFGTNKDVPPEQNLQHHITSSLLDQSDAPDPPNVPEPPNVPVSSSFLESRADSPADSPSGDSPAADPSGDQLLSKLQNLIQEEIQKYLSRDQPTLHEITKTIETLTIP